METIFDHQITEKEFKDIFGEYFKDKESYLKNMTIESHALVHIGELYEYRNDTKNAKKYYDLSGFPFDEIIDHCS